MGALLSVKARRSPYVLAERALLGHLLFVPQQGPAQTPSTSSPPYSLSVTVNEVGITFHAADANNLPVLDLKPQEVDVFDNEKGPGQIISMQQLRDRNIHTALVIDTSGSVAANVSHSRAEAQEAVQKLLVQADDRGTAVAFGRSRRVVQSWTHQKSSLANSIAEIGVGSRDPIDGTSVYDTLLSTCLYEFGKSAGPIAVNVILLFSDGEDTASHVTLRAAVDNCRQSHTVVYAFSPKPVSGTLSLGASTLRQITEQTGGRLFYADDPDGNIQADLETVELDLRNEYFLLYRPKTLIHNGAFHKIVLVGPERVVKIFGTSGFYAPAH